jgi:hypothetical protein
MPVKIGTNVDLKLLNLSGTAVPKAADGYGDYLPPGAPIRLYRKAGDLRNDGISYLFSSAYRKKNGLSGLNYVVDVNKGIYTTDALFVKPGEVNAAARRWVTPHNPIPSPAEGYTDTATCLQYRYSGDPEPTKSEWETATVRSSVGFFRVTNGTSVAGKRSHRDIPAHLKYLSDKYTHKIDWSSESIWYHGPPVAPSGVTEVPDPHGIPEGAPTTRDSPNVTADIAAETLINIEPTPDHTFELLPADDAPATGADTTHETPITVSAVSTRPTDSSQSPDDLPLSSAASPGTGGRPNVRVIDRASVGTRDSEDPSSS